MGSESSRSSKAYEGKAHEANEAEIGFLIRRHRCFLVCAHLNPDGDAIGSSAALALFLETEGKDVVVYNQDPVPELYRFIRGSERIVREIPADRRFDVSFLLDCGSPQRVGTAFERFAQKGQMVIIDHHPPTGPFQGVRLVRTRAAATSEILHDVMQAYGTPPTSEIATALYMGLVTDTGSFRFANTTGKALTTAAELQIAGADHRLVMEHLHENHPPERFMLLARVLQTLRFSCRGRVAYMEITRSMYGETGASEQLTDGFVDIPRSVQGVEVALLFREVAEGEYRVSMRSRGAVDVGLLASRFRGGGHPNAAGCTLDGDWEEVRRTMLGEVEKVLL